MRISPGVPLRASANAIVLERALTLHGGAIGEEVAPIQTLVLAEFVGTFILLLAVLMSARAPDWALRPIQLPVLTTLKGQDADGYSLWLSASEGVGDEDVAELLARLSSTPSGEIFFDTTTTCADVLSEYGTAFCE